MLARLMLLTRLFAVAMFGAAGSARAADDSFIIDVAPSSAPSSSAAPAAPSPLPRAARTDGAPATPAAPALKVTPLDGDGERPDESALRYYVALNQTNRANVEIQRLARLYPGWVPPVDLFEMDTSSRDEDVFWDMFTAEKLPELRAAIEARKRDDPGWQPSRDLVTKLRRKELRSRIASFWKDGRWQDLVDFIKTDGYDEDTDVDLLWTVAEAYGRTKQVGNAVGVYRSILSASQDPAARLATIQKAMALLRMADVEPLIAMGRVRSDGKSEFEPIMVDIVRQRISAFLHDERAAPIPADELAKFQVFAREAEDSNQSGLVAWYYYKTKAYRDALEWFKVALERGGDAMIAHGLAHSLRSLDMRRETEEVAYAWREPLVNNLILFIDILERDLTQENPPFIEPERLARYARVTMDVGSGEGAQGLAWYAYNSCQYTVALEWFSRAMAWFPKEATAYGYAMTLKRLKRQKEFFDVVNRYDGLFPQLLEIIFPDGQYHPPTACDLQAQQQLAPTQQAVGAPYAQPYVVPGATPTMQGGYGQQPYGQQTAGQPRYSQQAMMGYGAPPRGQASVPAPQYGGLQLPKLDPKEFPINVDPENPLRFAAAITGARSGTAQFFPPPSLHEPFRGLRSLVANRVSGVGAMPYERYGFSLLPGVDGLNAPSNPTHSKQPAPAGTLWATELDDKDRPRPAGGLPFGAPQSNPPTSLPPAQTSLPTSVPLSSAPQSFAPQSIVPQSSAASPPVRVVGAPAASSAALPAAVPAVAPAVVATSAAPPTGAQSLSDVAWTPTAARPVLPSSNDPAVLAQRAQQFFNDKNYAETIETLDQRATLAPETTDMRMIRGWSLLHLKRAEEARQVFAGLGRPAPAANARSR